MAELDDMDAQETLAAASCSVLARRRAEVEEMLVLAHWAYLHGDDPSERTGRAPRPGEDHLRRLGGEGTPAVRDHALGEIALAREAVTSRPLT